MAHIVSLNNEIGFHQLSLHTSYNRWDLYNSLIHEMNEKQISLYELCHEYEQVGTIVKQELMVC